MSRPPDTPGAAAGEVAGPAAVEQEATDAVLSNEPLPVVLAALARFAAVEAGGGHACVLLADENGDVLRVATAPSLPPSFAWAVDGTPIAAGAGPCATAMTTGTAVAANDLGGDPRDAEHRAGRAAGLRCCWAFPLPGRPGAGPVGVLAVLFEHTRPRRGDHWRRVERVALLVSLAVERSRTAALLEHQSSHDALTGLPNRGLLIDRLEMGLARTRRLASAVAVLFVDVDRLKMVNDSLGHDAGDTVLAAFGRRLSGAMRPGDTVARVGGDEFAVVCEDISGAHQAESIAHRLAELLARPCTIRGREVFASASIGIAVGTGEADARRLVRDAGTAMERAKDLGRGRVEMYDERWGTGALARLENEHALRRGVERREFVLHYQPEVRLGTHDIVGVEALARWSHPERGLLLPAEFIPAAEVTGLIVPMGAQLLSEACRQAATWDQLLGDDPFTVWVNLSGRQLASPDFTDQVAAMIEDAGVPPGRLGFEITENEAMADAEAVVGRLRELRRLGSRIAIDDFGTGYSSLAYLKRFPIDQLKVDRAFVEGVTAGAEDASIVAAVISLARTLGLDVVAEGVETMEQGDVLERLGCELAQGFHYARPQAADEVTAMLIQRAWDTEVNAR